MSKILSVILAVLLFFPSPAIAQVAFQTEQLPNGTAEIPDWQKTTFGDLPPLTTRGELQDLAKEQGGLKLKKKHAKKIEKLLGYNPARAWEEGSPVSKVIKLGDLQEFGIAEKSLSELTQGTSKDVNKTALSELGTTDEQTINSLSKIIPSINSVKVGDIPVFKELLINASKKNSLPEAYDRYEARITKELEKINPRLTGLPLRELLARDWDGLLDKSTERALKELGEINPLLKNIPLNDIFKGDFKAAADKAVKAGLNVAVATFLKENPVAGNIPLGSNADLTKFAIASVPGLKDVPVGNIPGLKDQSISEVPGVDELPLSDVLNLSDLLKIRFAKVDLTLGEKEQKAPFTISGSTRGDKFKAEPCVQGGSGVKNCAHIELADNVTLPGLSVKGRQWVAGASQSVKGGKGLLKIVNGGKEPTGVTVFGSKPNIKVVINNINEAKGKADLQIYLRVCVKILFTKHCTPYFLGPIPFGSVSEKGLIMVASSSPPNVVIPPDLQRQIDSIEGEYSPSEQACPIEGSQDSKHGHLEYEEVERDRLVAIGQYRNGRTEYLRADAAAAYKKMLNDSGFDFIPISGFRSFDDQNTLWNNQVERRGSESEAAKYSAPPGFSEHHTGLSVDIGWGPSSNTDLSQSFANTPAYQWLKTYAPKYGFELSFPQGNSQGVSFEPWHWRYKGGSAGDVFADKPKQSNSPKANMDLYLARIRLGESDNCQNIGPNKQTGAYGCYQFIKQTRDSVLRLYGVDAWGSREQQDAAAIALIRDVGKQINRDVVAIIEQGDFAEADKILGTGKHIGHRFGTFTSLPGGDEESTKWKDPVLVAKYSPGGTGGGSPCVESKPCPPGKPCLFANPNPKGYIPFRTGLYGAGRSGGRTHLGVDLQSPKGAQNAIKGPGDPIFAIADGKVSEHKPTGATNCGGIVTLQHANGLESRYVHMYRVIVKPRATVKRGETIGIEGNEIDRLCSGGTHLHLETYQNGEAFDPTSLKYDPPMPTKPRF